MQIRYIAISFVTVNFLILSIFFLSNTHLSKVIYTKEHNDIINLIENIDYPPPQGDIIRIVSVLGTSAEVIKFAKLLHHFETKPRIDSIVISTNQEWEMTEQQMKFFGLKSDLVMDVMQPNQTISDAIAEIILLLGKAFAKLRPSLILVQGDTVTAMATSIAAFYSRIPVGHIEAGIRTMNIYSPFPEEMHRRVIAVVTQFHFAPSELAASRLIDEGFSNRKIYVTGNTEIDSFMWTAKQGPSEKAIDVINKYKLDSSDTKTILVSTHSREISESGIENICRAVKKIADARNVQILLLSPNILQPAKAILNGSPNIHFINPLAYDEMVHVMKRTYFIITDSEEIQELAVASGKPLLLVRGKTERLEGVLAGVVKMVGDSVGSIVSEANNLIVNQSYYESLTKPRVSPYGYGNSSEIITDIILQHGYRLINGKWALEMEAEFARTAQESLLTNKYPYSWRGDNGKLPTEKEEEAFNNKELVKYEIEGRKPTINTRFCSSFKPLPPQKHDTHRDFKLPQTRTYDEMMSLPSKYVHRAPEFEYTLIVGAWRRPQFIARILDAFATQTHPPKEMWVSIFASPTEKEYRDVLNLYKMNSTIPVKVTIGDPQLSYWGRFQLGLQVNTPYLIVLDDDCVPGKKFAESILHMMNTENYRGIYGIKGFIGSEFLLSPGYLSAVDVVGGVWFMESKWLKSIFFETPHTWLTGEDYQFAYSARKYLNIPSFIAPWKDADTRGISSDYITISIAGDTTWTIKDGRLQKRQEIIEFHRRRGYAQPSMNFATEGIMVVVENVAQAKRLADTFTHLNTVIKSGTKFNNIFAGVLTSGNAVSDNQAGVIQAFGLSSKSSNVFDMMLANDLLPHERRTTDMQAESLYAATQIFEYLRVQVIVGIISDTKSLVGVVTAAEELNIPFIGLSPKELEIPTLTSLTEKVLQVQACKICLTTQCAVDSVLAIVMNDCQWK